MKKDTYRDQVVIVTGASAGIGKSLALLLASPCAKDEGRFFDQPEPRLNSFRWMAHLFRLFKSMRIVLLLFRRIIMKMTNLHNLIAYRRWAPVYDATVNHIFTSGRKRALSLLSLQPGENVLIVGVGTGADFPFLPAGVDATGIDLSPDMLAKARLKLSACRATVELIQGDAQVPFVLENSFDAAILNLILSVVPDGRACLQSAFGAIRPGGRLVIFDKFQPDHERITLGRRFMNFFSTRLGTDITRRFSDMLAGCSCKIVHDEPSLLGGMYRVILLRKD